MRKMFLLVLLSSTTIILSACGHSINSSSPQTTQSQTNSSQTGSSQSNSDQTNLNQTSNSDASQNQQSNIELAEDPSSANTIHLFYQDLNEKNYKSAVALLGPQLKFYGNPSNIKYLQNIQKTNFVKFEDISDDPGVVEANYDQYYKIKIYYAEVNYQVQNPDLVPGLNGMNYRKFILIKKSPNDPWLIDTNEATPQMK